MKALMYHYVQTAPDGMPHFRYLHLDDFIHQIEHLLGHDRILGQEEFLEAIRTGRVPRDGIVLTFDDGFSGHHRFVLPQLTARGLWGIFYVPTGAYTNRKLLDVHRIHCLLGQCGGVAIMNEVQDLITPQMLIHERVEEFRTMTYVRQDNDAATTIFKRIMNYFISAEWRTAILDRLMKTHFDEEHLLQEFYLSSDQIKHLHDAGMIVGSHSVSHPVFSTLDRAGQKREILDSFAFLDMVTGGLAIRTFCYPYGGYHSFTTDTEKILAENNCLFSFNVEPRVITSVDVMHRPQALPRYDCNQFPHGKARMGRVPAP